MGIQSSKVEHLYVHVPFCAAKCNYCGFYSEAGSAAKMGDYVDAVLAELGGFAGQLAPRTIFFGGGTPSLLPAALMRRILEGLRQSVSLKGVTEWTVECNPATVSSEKAKLFREFGVNRISMGVQALDDESLKTLGRVHSVKSAIASYGKLREAGFDNINLDLMFGLPGQTLAHWRRTLGEAIALQPEHFSTYCLILEEDTHFWSLLQNGSIKPDDELELAMYETAMEMLAAAGYRQYEISNFAKPNRPCAHNIAYWEGKDYLGLGPSACSTVGGRRWQNIPDIDSYIEGIRSRRPSRGERRDAAPADVGEPKAEPSGGERVQPVVIFEEVLTPELRAAERAAFGMRMNAGVPAELVTGRWDKEIAELLSAELVQWRDNRLQPTKRGILFADEVAAQFV
jgi:oxygen-independent coproporphyrinogen-3 oxidase